MIGRLRCSLQECLEMLKDIAKRLLDEYWLDPDEQLDQYSWIRGRLRELLKVTVQEIIIKRPDSDPAMKYFYDSQTACRT